MGEQPSPALASASASRRSSKLQLQLSGTPSEAWVENLVQTESFLKQCPRHEHLSGDSRLMYMCTWCPEAGGLCRYCKVQEHTEHPCVQISSRLKWPGLRHSHASHLLDLSHVYPYSSSNNGDPFYFLRSDRPFSASRLCCTCGRPLVFYRKQQLQQQQRQLKSHAKFCSLMCKFMAEPNNCIVLQQEQQQQQQQPDHDDEVEDVEVPLLTEMDNQRTKSKTHKENTTKHAEGVEDAARTKTHPGNTRKVKEETNEEVKAMKTVAAPARRPRIKVGSSRRKATSAARKRTRKPANRFDSSDDESCSENSDEDEDESSAASTTDQSSEISSSAPEKVVAQAQAPVEKLNPNDAVAADETEREPKNKVEDETSQARQQAETLMSNEKEQLEQLVPSKNGNSEQNQEEEDEDSTTASLLLDEVEENQGKSHAAHLETLKKSSVITSFVNLCLSPFKRKRKSEEEVDISTPVEGVETDDVEMNEQSEEPKSADEEMEDRKYSTKELFSDPSSAEATVVQEASPIPSPSPRIHEKEEEEITLAKPSVSEASLATRFSTNTTAVAAKDNNGTAGTLIRIEILNNNSQAVRLETFNVPTIITHDGPMTLDSPQHNQRRGAQNHLNALPPPENK